MNRHLPTADPRLSRAVKPTVELLEARTLLSVASPGPITNGTATLRGTTLLVTGTHKADQIVMSLHPDDVNTLQVRIKDALVGEFAVDDIALIRAYGQGGSDRISIDETYGEVLLRADLLGGNGNDTLTSSGGNDSLIGNKGDDLLQSRGGNDWVEGNAGKDRILAGDGRDTVIGGPSADTINSGAGRDKVVGKEKGDVVDTGVATTVDLQKRPRIANDGPEVKKRKKLSIRANAFNGTVTGLTPQQIRTAYEFGDLDDPTFTNRGRGQHVAVVVAYHYPTALDDLNEFSRQFGLPELGKRQFKYVYASGDQPEVDRGWAHEAALDIQWVHAIAPEAKIYLVEADTNSTADINRAITRAANVLQPNGGVINMSLGGDESFIDPLFTDVFRNAQTSNVSFVAASGDDGGQVSSPGVDAEVLSVGGTFLTVDADGNRIAEEAWLEGGGGTSQIFDRPDYQDNLVIDGATIGEFRVVPDVAYNADPMSGVAVYTTTPTPAGNTGWDSVGGTSAGAPQWSGIVALANERRLQNGLNVIGSGQLNNFVYGIARKFYTQTFNDIETGSNTFHQATEGFDQATGWGTPRASNLIDQLAVITSRRDRVSERNRFSFEWRGNFRQSLYFGLPGNAVSNFSGIGTADITPNVVDLIMEQGPGNDPVTGLPPILSTLDQIEFDARTLERIGNTVIGRGLAQVVTADGFPAQLLLKFEGRLFRNNGQDQIIGEFYAISSRGRILAQGQDAILRGEFSSRDNLELGND